MQKFIRGMFVMLLLVAVGSAVALGYLFYLRSQDVTKLQADKVLADNQITQLQLAAKAETDKLFTWRDDGLGAKVDYLKTWTPVLNTSMKFADAGVLNEKYELTFSKGAAVLKFTKIMGGVGGVPAGLSSVKYDIVQLPGNKIVRFAEKGTSNWTYEPIYSCSGLSSDLIGPDANNLCVDMFFPGFGKATFAAQAKLTGATAPADIAEADAMVVSALN